MKLKTDSTDGTMVFEGSVKDIHQALAYRDSDTATLFIGLVAGAVLCEDGVIEASDPTMESLDNRLARFTANEKESVIRLELIEK